MGDREEWAISIKAVAASIGPPGLFRCNGGSLNEFLIEILPECGTVAQVAAQLAFYFSVDDGVYNRFQPGLVLSTTFLFNNKIRGRETYVGQAAADLKKIMQESPDLSKLQTWATSHQP